VSHKVLHLTEQTVPANADQSRKLSVRIVPKILVFEKFNA